MQRVLHGSHYKATQCLTISFNSPTGTDVRGKSTKPPWTPKRSENMEMILEYHSVLITSIRSFYCKMNMYVKGIRCYLLDIYSVLQWI